MRQENSNPHPLRYAEWDGNSAKVMMMVKMRGRDTWLLWQIIDVAASKYHLALWARE